MHKSEEATLKFTSSIYHEMGYLRDFALFYFVIMAMRRVVHEFGINLPVSPYLYGE